MFPFAELVDNYFADDDQDSRNSGDDENPVEVLMKTYFSLSYSDCCDNNPFAADIRTRFIRDFRSLIDEFEDESEDEWDGNGSCADDGCPLCWPDHVCSARKVPSNLTDSVIRLVASVYESSRPRSTSRFEVFFLAEKVKQLTKFSPQRWRFWKTKAEHSLKRLSEFCEKVCDTLILEMENEFCKLLGLPSDVSNIILKMLLEDSIKKDVETMVKFEDQLVENEFIRTLLIDVFNYLATTWIEVVWKIKSFPCYCYYPYLTGFREVYVPDNVMEDWRDYFGLAEDDNDNTILVIGDGNEELTMEDDAGKD